MSSLFERLSTAMPSFQPKFRQELAGRRIDTIKRHLETLLNARQGCSQSSPGLGLPDFNGNHMANGDLLIQVSADIRRYMEDGPQSVPRPRLSTQFPSPIQGFSAQFEGIGRFFRTSGWLMKLALLMIWPAFVIMGTAHWVNR
jgi:hypothetical protein